MEIHSIFFFLFYVTTTVVSQGLSMSVEGLAFNDLLITYSRIVGPTNGGKVHLRLDLMTGMFLSRKSQRQYHETCLFYILPLLASTFKTIYIFCYV